MSNQRLFLIGLAATMLAWALFLGALFLVLLGLMWAYRHGELASDLLAGAVAYVVLARFVLFCVDRRREAREVAPATYSPTTPPNPRLNSAA